MTARVSVRGRGPVFYQPIDSAGWRKKGKAPMEFVLDNGSVRVALSTAGGSFTSIKANGREYLWQGDPSVWSGQAPICFPICGGLRDGHAMTMGGREVKLARHGFARKQEWKLEEQGDNMVVLSLSSDRKSVV